VLAILSRPGDGEGSPEPVEVGRARWTGSGVQLVVPEDAPEGAREALERVFRATPVVIDDPSLRSPGSRGPTILEPGDLRWFIGAASSRAERESLSVQLVASDVPVMGWDPAGAYRTFQESVERRERIAP